MKKNQEFVEAKSAYEKSLEAKGKVTQALPLSDMGCCTASLTEFAERYIEVRSHGSASEDTIKNELRKAFQEKSHAVVQQLGKP